MLKFNDMMYLQNCLFMLQMEQNQKLASSFPGLNPCDHETTMIFRKTDMRGKKVNKA